MPSTIIGALLGPSNVTTYVESSVGIEAGGRTGLTAVSASLCFFLSLFLAPLVGSVPMSAISPILIFVGLSMIENIVKIDWKDVLIAIPSFFIVIMMPLSYSITTGIQFGFIFYILVNIANNKGKEICAIVKLKTRINGHKATISDDYQRLKGIVQAKMGEEKLQKWIVDKQKNTYVRINDNWVKCDFKYPGWVRQ